MTRVLTCDEVSELAPLYVLDALDRAESAEVRAHLAGCAQPHAEFAELGGVVPYLAELGEEAPPDPELRSRVMAAILAEGRPNAAATALTPTGAAWTPRPASHREATPVSLDRPRPRRITPRVGWLLSAAAVLLIGVLGVWNVLLQQAATDARQRQGIVTQALLASTRPDSRVAQLRGTPEAPGSTGLLALGPNAGYLVVEGLPPAPPGRIYQAWYIAGGTPRSAGLVEVGSDGLLVVSGLDPRGPVEQFALTLEPAGGVVQPTGSKVIAGEVATGS